MKWISPFTLNRLGLLSMNRRNVDYISRYNDRRAYPLVDNKLKTRTLAREYHVASPGLNQVVRQQHEIPHFRETAESLTGFAIKPAKGSGGKGILVITGRDGEHFVKASGQKLDIGTVERHLSNILAGLYSLGGAPDVAIVEELIRTGGPLEGQSFQGVPDIRIVLFRGYQVMAMLRLSTRASDGKANLHQGAVGVGLDIGSGQALHAVQFNHAIERHPDTGNLLNALSIPNWETLLIMASRCYEATGLGYLGADMVLDESKGPILLELNARPGLAIQVANGAGLLPRLRHIEALRRLHLTPEERVHYAMTRFGKHSPIVA